MLCLQFGGGGPGRVRTVDLFHAMEARSQLRHRPTRRLHYNIRPAPVKFTCRIRPHPRPPTMEGMVFRRLPAAILLICLTSAALPSCLARRRLITRKATNGKTPPNLQVAGEGSLLDSVAREYNAIRDFSGTVDMTPALGSAEKSHITEYKDITGYVLFRKPADIRIIGLYPIIRSKAFDMASSGGAFKLYLPSRNAFLVGQNEAVKPSPNKIENLRPQYFLDAMLVRPIDLKNNKVLMENMTDEDGAYYILHEIHEAANGRLQLRRTIWFN